MNCLTPTRSPLFLLVQPSGDVWVMEDYGTAERMAREDGGQIVVLSGCDPQGQKLATISGNPGAYRLAAPERTKR